MCVERRERERVSERGREKERVRICVWKGDREGARQDKTRQGKTEKLPPSPSFHLAILHYPSLTNNLISPNIFNPLQNILIWKQIDRQTDGQP